MTWYQIDDNGLRLFPIRRDLQGCWTAESPMRDQHLFPKVLAVTRCNDFSGHSRQIGIASTILRSQQQRHQRRTSLTNRQPELPRQIVAQTTRPHLWNRQSPRRDDQNRSVKFLICGPCNKLRGTCYFVDRSIRKDMHSSLAAFLFEHS